MPKLKLKAATPQKATNPGVTNDRLVKAAEAARLPTLDDLRKKYELGTKERLRIEAQEFLTLDRAAKDAGNATNRQKTQLKKAFNAFKQAEGLKPEDAIVLGDTELLLDVAYADVIDPRALYDYMKRGLITEEQFLNSISVGKEASKLACGAHVTDALTKTIPGKEIDIRKRPADPPSASNDIVIKRADEPEVREPKVSKPKETVAPISATATIKRAGSVRLRRKIG